MPTFPLPYPLPQEGGEKYFIKTYYLFDFRRLMSKTVMETLVRFTYVEVESKAAFVSGKKVLLTFTVQSIILFINECSGIAAQDPMIILPEIFLQ